MKVIRLIWNERYIHGHHDAQVIRNTSLGFYPISLVEAPNLPLRLAIKYVPRAFLLLLMQHQIQLYYGQQPALRRDCLALVMHRAVAAFQSGIVGRSGP